MNRLTKILAICIFLGIVNVLMSCFKAQHAKVRINDIKIDAIDSTSSHYLLEGDTCRLTDLVIFVDLVVENVASLSIPTFINSAYAFQINSYFDFTNEIKELQIFIKETNLDSIEVTNDCIFTYNQNEFTEADELILSMNSEFDYYKDNAVDWPMTRFSFKINSTDSNRIAYKCFIVNVKLSDVVITGSTDFFTFN